MLWKSGSFIRDEDLFDPASRLAHLMCEKVPSPKIMRVWRSGSSFRAPTISTTRVGRQCRVMISSSMPNKWHCSTATKVCWCFCIGQGTMALGRTLSTVSSCLSVLSALFIGYTRV